MTDPIDGTQGPAPTGTDPAPTGNEPGRTFTQADLDRIVGERLARQQRQTETTYADYDDLQEKATRLAEIEEAEKSEADKAQDRIAAAEAALEAAKADNARLAQERTDALLRSAVVSKATTLGFRDPSDVVALLDMAALELQDDGTVTGADEALTALSEAKPYLLGTITPRLGPTAGGRTSKLDGETREEKKARIYGGGGDGNVYEGPGGGFIPLQNSMGN